MEPPSPARLYATAVGLLLVVLGILGCFYDASFGTADSYEEAFGEIQVNGWLNLLYVATGALGLYVAGVASRAYSLSMGLLYVVLAILGWGTGALHLAIGLLGLAAAAGAPKPGRRRAKRGSKVGREPTKEPRNSEPRAKPARKRA